MAIINRSRLIQIGWLVAIWSVSVVTLGLVAYGLRWLLQP